MPDWKGESLMKDYRLQLQGRSYCFNRETRPGSYASGDLGQTSSGRWLTCTVTRSIQMLARSVGPCCAWTDTFLCRQVKGVATAQS